MALSFGLGVDLMLPNLIVPTLNRYDLLQRLVDSFDYPIKHLLVIDNGGNLKELVVPDVVQQLTILNMPSNLGVSSSWNLGIKSFPFDDRWFIASDDTVFAPASLKLWHEISDSKELITSEEDPYWQFFVIGEEIVGNVGLFDEAIHPANFEDDEYEWRCEAYGYAVNRAQIQHHHDGQGTVFHSDYAHKNRGTYVLNASYFDMKKNNKDYSDGYWMLARRRLNSWD
jgi:glycosyltransferase involved in cell wall biosynthesis